MSITPLGLPTLLFTDIEGSTRLWEDDPERMRRALACHDRIVRAAIEGRAGVLVKTTGDGVYAAFDRTSDAIAAAVDMQLALADPAATDGVAVRIRCGMHRGPVERRFLVILDNCEHVARGAAEVVSALLASGTGARVLASSREPLGIAGETTYALPPLAAPASDADASLLARNDAVRLFAERGAAARPGFAIGEANGQAVARICRRLDGIPLAIELAAARVRSMSVDAIEARLSDRFRLLTGGDASALPRQQTLRGCIEWSHDLLSPPERALMRRIAVFAGDFPLQSAEQVVADDHLDEAEIAGLLAQLVEKSLAEYDAASDRYRQLETVRQFSAERLAASGEEDALRARHFDVHAALAESAINRLIGPEQKAWMARLGLERENMLAAHAHARVRLAASLSMMRELGLANFAGAAMAATSALAAAVGDFEACLRLEGAGAAHRERTGFRLEPVDEACLRPFVARARASLDAGAAARARLRGRAPRRRGVAGRRPRGRRIVVRRSVGYGRFGRSIVVPRLRLVRVDDPGRDVPAPQQQRERRADERGGEVRLPRVGALQRHHAPGDAAVEERDDERRRDRAPVATQQARKEDERGEPVDQPARPQVDCVAAEEPDGDAGREPDPGKHDRRRTRVEVQHRGA